MFDGGVEHHDVVILGVLRDFQRALGPRPVVKQKLGAIQLYFRQFFVLHRLAVIRIRARHIHAADLEQDLALLHFVTQACVNFDNAAGGKRRHLHLLGYIRQDLAGHIQLRRGHMLARRYGGKLVRMFDLEVVVVDLAFHILWGRSAGGSRRVLLSFELSRIRLAKVRRSNKQFHLRAQRSRRAPSSGSETVSRRAPFCGEFLKSPHRAGSALQTTRNSQAFRRARLRCAGELLSRMRRFIENSVIGKRFIAKRFIAESPALRPC